MDHAPLIGLAAIVVLAVAGQVIAARLRVPSILVLLVLGMLAGPVTGLLDPDALLGELIFPVVSLAVAIILFEGGLLLNLDELRGDTSTVVRRLLTVGVPVTAVSAGLVARYVLGISTPIAALLGAVLTVTGPTVIVPLLRFLEPSERVEVTLKWEGIFVDAIGAALTVIAFEAVRATGDAPAVPEAVLQVAVTLLVGAVVGVVGAFVLVLTLDADLVEPPVEAAATIMVVLTAFVAANLLRPESGLATAIVMGIALANQKRIAVDRIAEFKETLGMLLTGALFILLSARLELDALVAEFPAAVALTAILVLVVRPVAVALASARSDFSWRERGLIAWMAPRGIVAAATASLFAFELSESDIADVDRLVPLTFLVILLTVTIYGLTAGPVARALGLLRDDDTTEDHDDGDGDDGDGRDAGRAAAETTKAAAKDVATGLGLDPDEE